MLQPHPLIAALAAERERRNIPRPALARRAGYADDTLRKWERGDTIPGLDGLTDLAAALGLRIALVPADTDPASTNQNRTDTE